MSFADIVGNLLAGLGYTVLVTFSCAATALIVGLAITAARRLGGRAANLALEALVYVLRGIPVLVLLFVVFFGLPAVGLDVPPLLAMMLSLGLVSGAYLSEIYRGSLQGVAQAELLAARAAGFTSVQTFRLIELPQMVRLSVPGMVNELTTVMKYSPFAYTVGIPEITKQAMALTSATMQGLQIYAAVGLLYFGLYRAILLVVAKIEQHFAIPGFAEG